MALLIMAIYLHSGFKSFIQLHKKSPGDKTEPIFFKIFQNKKIFEIFKILKNNS